MRLRTTLNGIGTALIATAMSASTQIAGPPGLIDYQGRLRDSDNAPLDGGTPTNFEVHFRIWEN